VCVCVCVCIVRLACFPACFPACLHAPRHLDRVPPAARDRAHEEPRAVHLHARREGHDPPLIRQEIESVAGIQESHVSQRGEGSVRLSVRPVERSSARPTLRTVVQEDRVGGDSGPAVLQ